MYAILAICECTPPSDPFSPMNTHQNWIEIQRIAHLLLPTCKHIPSPNVNHGIETEVLLYLPAKGGQEDYPF
jgi:hypothetical protein